MYKTVLLSFFLICVTVTKGTKVKEVAVNIGRNITIFCPITKAGDIEWSRDGRKDTQKTEWNVLEDGTLFLANVEKNSSGVYICSRRNSVDSDEVAKINVTVRTPPPPLKNVVVRPSTILALLLWDLAGDGGYPIVNFTAQYRLAYTNTSWLPISPNHITPNSRQIEVYNLTPNTTYQFRIWATNQLGRSPQTEVYGTTLDVYSEEELARHLLQGVETFDRRIWAVAVGIVMGTLILLGLGVCFLLYHECRISSVGEEHEVIELVPNIILNPGFDPNTNPSDQVPDENSNNETPMRLNNNTVIHPIA
nr:unnamed protein product [Callosobruchus chinensis]